MLIKVFYQSGRLDVFDTASFCTAEPFRSQGDNLMSEFQLMTDAQSLENEGLLLEVYWYDPRVREDTPRSGPHNLPHAARQSGRRIRLASRSELNDIALITVDGDLVLWRQGGHLINGVKFQSQEVLCYSSAATASINKRALALYDYIRKAYPDLDGEEAAALLGYTKQAIEDVSAAEIANADLADEEDAEDEDWDFA